MVQLDTGGQGPSKPGRYWTMNARFQEEMEDCGVLLRSCSELKSVRKTNPRSHRPRSRGRWLESSSEPADYKYGDDHTRDVEQPEEMARSFLMEGSSTDAALCRLPDVLPFRGKVARSEQE